MPSRLPEITYPPGDETRTVQSIGVIDFRHRRWRVGKGLRGERVRIRPTGRDGEWTVYYGRTRLRTLDFTAARLDG